MDGVQSLIERLHAVLARGGSDAERAEAVAECLRAGLPAVDELTPEQRAGEPGRYVQHVLHVEADPLFTVLALVWPAGQQTTVHDHLCWGAVAVLQGSEHETRFRLEPDQAGPSLHPARETTYAPGDACWFAPPHDIHRVTSGAADATISLHVYGADIAALGSSVKTIYPPGLVRA